MENLIQKFFVEKNDKKENFVKKNIYRCFLSKGSKSTTMTGNYHILH